MKHSIRALTLLLATACSPSGDGSDDGSTTGASETSHSSDAPTTDSEPTEATSEPQTSSSVTATTTATASGGSMSGETGETNETSATGETGETSETSETSDGSSTGGVCMTPPLAPVDLGAPDDLGAAGAYALLAKTGVTNVTGTHISGGHVGVSPAAATSITGFTLIADPSGVYASSPVVMAPGKVYAADYDVPTPIKLTTAVLKMQAAYSDAAGRSPADYLNLHDGDLGGLTLAPGLYKWGSSVIIPADVTISGCNDDVWIFQVDGDFDVSVGKQVVLADGARPENIFWQIAGEVTVHADAHLEGVVLGMTGITLQTGATLHGRALAQSLIALDDNSVTTP